MKGRVVLPASVRAALIAHARREQPHECCGLLLGRGAQVAFARPMRNVSLDPVRRFALDAREHLDLRRALRGLAPALELVGVYHSHPNGRPVPSVTDLAEAHYPDWVHIIVGLVDDRASVRAYRLPGGNRVQPVTIVAGALHRR